jgi:hypothetical protein
MCLGIRGFEILARPGVWQQSPHFRDVMGEHSVIVSHGGCIRRVFGALARKATRSSSSVFPQLRSA